MALTKRQLKALEEALGHGQQKHRAEAVADALSQLRDSPTQGLTLAQLRPWASAEDWQLRESCAALLVGFTEQPGALEILHGLATDPSRRVNRAAFRSLLDFLPSIPRAEQNEWFSLLRHRKGHDTLELLLARSIEEDKGLGIRRLLKSLEHSPLRSMEESEAPYLKMLYQRLQHDPNGSIEDFLDYTQSSGRERWGQARDLGDLDIYPPAHETADPHLRAGRRLIRIWRLSWLRDPDAVELLYELYRNAEAPEELLGWSLEICTHQRKLWHKLRPRYSDHDALLAAARRWIEAYPTARRQTTAMKVMAHMELPPFELFTALLPFLSCEHPDELRYAAYEAWQMQSQNRAELLQQDELILLLREFLHAKLDKISWGALCHLLDHLDESLDLEMIAEYVDLHVDEESRQRFSQHKTWTWSLLDEAPHPFFQISRQLHLGLFRSDPRGFPSPEQLGLLLQSPAIAHIQDLNAGDLLHSSSQGDHAHRKALLDGLCASRSLGQLQSLQLQNIGLGDGGLSALLNDLRAPQLSRLYLSGNRLSDQSVGMLLGWPGLASLESLSLRNNELTRKGLERLCQSPATAQLRRLMLKGNRLRTADIEACLAASPHGPSWREGVRY